MATESLQLLEGNEPAPVEQPSQEEPAPAVVEPEEPATEPEAGTEEETQVVAQLISADPPSPGM